MEILENSILGGLLLRLWALFSGWYEGSGLCRHLRGGAALGRRWGQGSALVRLVSREGVFPRAWRDGFFCRLGETLMNLPAGALHWIYRRGKPLFDHSFFAQLAFAMGEQVPSAIGWLMLAIMVIPYEQWDNRYSLIGFALMFLLFLAGGMRSRPLRLDL